MAAEQPPDPKSKTRSTGKQFRSIATHAHQELLHFQRASSIDRLLRLFPIVRENDTKWMDFRHPRQSEATVTTKLSRVTQTSLMGAGGVGEFVMIRVDRRQDTTRPLMRARMRLAHECVQVSVL